jgi:hypothetical protein
MQTKCVALSLLTLLLGVSAVACSDSFAPDRTCVESAMLATTYEVGPGKPYADLQAVAPLLAAGDVVEVSGKAGSYPGGVVFSKSGTAASKITVRGVRVNGARPILSGGSNTVQFDGSHYVFEGFDVTAGSVRGVFHHADDITIKDTVVHDCVGHGILGADEGSGSLTLDHVEVYACGSGTQRHPIYMATDETMYPDAVFRMQFSYLHNQNGGDAVKSRAGRNELYYNWIEGGFYRELELNGPDGQDPALKREDSDVVGNVFLKTQGTNVARIGGDGTGDTGGRYRFVNNTFILQATKSSAIQVFDRVESLEMHNNVFYRLGGGGLSVLDTEDTIWTTGAAVVTGGNNWVPTGTTELPATCAATQGTDPGFAALVTHDFRLGTGSALAAKGALATASPAGHPFTSPMALPLFVPPLHAVDPIGMAVPRAPTPSVSIGAYEVGSQTVPPVPSGNGGGGGTGGGTGGADGGTGAPGSGGTGGGGGSDGTGTGSGTGSGPYSAQRDGC